MIFKGRLFVFVAANFRSKSEKAEQEHLEHVFVCQNGGGEKGESHGVGGQDTVQRCKSAKVER